MNHTESEHKADCRHHWVIDQADGPTSSGRCRVCGITKSFLNVYEDVVAELEARGIEPQTSVGAAVRRKAA